MYTVFNLTDSPDEMKGGEKRGKISYTNNVNMFIPKGGL
jgi:hypothetical protein